MSNPVQDILEKAWDIGIYDVGGCTNSVALIALCSLPGARAVSMKRPLTPVSRVVADDNSVETWVVKVPCGDSVDLIGQAQIPGVDPRDILQVRVDYQSYRGIPRNSTMTVTPDDKNMFWLNAKGVPLMTVAGDQVTVTIDIRAHHRCNLSPTQLIVTQYVVNPEVRQFIEKQHPHLIEPSQ